MASKCMILLRNGAIVQAQLNGLGFPDLFAGCILTSSSNCFSGMTPGQSWLRQWCQSSPQTRQSSWQPECSRRCATLADGLHNVMLCENFHSSSQESTFHGITEVFSWHLSDCVLRLLHDMYSTVVHLNACAGA